MLRLAVPSDGALHEPSLLFLKECGLAVRRTNLRRYTAEVPRLPGLIVHFQRGSDIGIKVEEGSADMGILGRDRFLETSRKNGDTAIVINNLGFGQSNLVIGVPDSWIDVTSTADLAELSMDFRDQGKELQIATKYPKLVERFLLDRGVNFFSLVEASGTLEAAPAMGYADIIADISSTGTTLRENRLKTIEEGSVISSEACLIINKSIDKSDPRKLQIVNDLVQSVEAHLQALNHYSITANMAGKGPKEIAELILDQADISGLRGPTISKVYNSGEEDWYAVTVIVEKEKLLNAVTQFKKIGGNSVTVSQPNYVFHAKSDATDMLKSIGF